MTPLNNYMKNEILNISFKDKEQFLPVKHFNSKITALNFFSELNQAFFSS
jgi:hypothetical protein